MQDLDRESKCAVEKIRPILTMTELQVPPESLIFGGLAPDGNPKKMFCDKKGVSSHGDVARQSQFNH